MTKFAINQTVYRKEDRAEAEAEAVVVDIDSTENNILYKLEYVEGGAGWWPESSLSETPVF